jgi:hypothetical protein
VRVHEARLADDRLGHARVAVADGGDVVVRVQQPPAVCGVQPDALGADDVHRVVVRQRSQRWPEYRVAAAGELRRRHRRARCAELVRDLVVAEGVELLEQRPRVGVPGLDVLRVLGVPLDAPGADRDDRGQAGGDEVAKELELERLERDPRLVAVRGDPRCAEGVLGGTAAQ